MLWFPTGLTQFRKWARLPDKQRLALYDLTTESWHSEKGLPNDPAKAARTINTPLTNVQQVWELFLAECEERNGFLRLREMWAGLDKYHQRARQRQEAGLISAMRREDALLKKQDLQQRAVDEAASNQNSQPAINNTLSAEQSGQIEAGLLQTRDLGQRTVDEAVPLNNQLSASQAPADNQLFEGKELNPSTGLQQINDLDQRTVDEPKSGDSFGTEFALYNSSSNILNPELSSTGIGLVSNTNQKEKLVLTDKEKAKGNFDLRQAAKEIFAFWQETTGKVTARFTDGRQRKVEARLREGYTVEQIKRGILGCQRSEFHQGLTDTSDGRIFNDLELICRTGTKLEQFIELADRWERQQQERATPASWLNGSAGARFAFAASGHRLGAPGTDKPQFQRTVKDTGQWIDRRLQKLQAEGWAVNNDLLNADAFIEFWQFAKNFNGYPAVTTIPKYLDEFIHWQLEEREEQAANNQPTNTGAQGTVKML